MIFKNGSAEVERVNTALRGLGDLSLHAEVHRYRCCGRKMSEIDEDIKKLENRLWEMGHMQRDSLRRLELANARGRIQDNLIEQVAEEVHESVRRGCPT